jgi:hypothetical protein
MLVTTSLATCGMSCLPDLMPADFFIFPKVITTLKGRLLDITDIKKNVTIVSNVVTFYAFDECLVQLLEGCNTCVAILRDNSKAKQKYSSYFICFCSCRPNPRTVLTDLVQQRSTAVWQVHNKQQQTTLSYYFHILQFSWTSQHFSY